MTHVQRMIEHSPFLVGARRSGTTLFRLLLDNHPQIAWHHLGFEYAIEKIGHNCEWPDLDDYRRWLASHRIFQTHGFKVDPELSYPALVNNFLVQRREQAGKACVGATVHYSFDKITCVWPDARLIYLVRDPRGIAASNLRLKWAGNGWAAAQSWIDAEDNWRRVRRSLPPEQCLEIAYEDLVLDTRNTLEKVCTFIGVPYDEAMLAYAETGQEPPHPRHLEKWRRDCSERDIQLLEARIGERLLERGYPLSGLPRLRVGQAHQRLLMLQDRWFRARSRMQHYGLPVFLADFLSRRLQLRSWQHLVRRRMNAMMCLLLAEAV